MGGQNGRDGVESRGMKIISALEAAFLDLRDRIYFAASSMRKLTPTSREAARALVLLRYDLEQLPLDEIAELDES